MKTFLDPVSAGIARTGFRRILEPDLSHYGSAGQSAKSGLLPIVERAVAIEAPPPGGRGQVRAPQRKRKSGPTSAGHEAETNGAATPPGTGRGSAVQRSDVRIESQNQKKVLRTSLFPLPKPPIRHAGAGSRKYKGNEGAQTLAHLLHARMTNRSRPTLVDHDFPNGASRSASAHIPV